MARRRFLHGPPPVLPGWADRAHLAWVRLPPRARVALWALLLVTLLGQCAGHRARVAGAWGGQPVTVLLARQTLPVGADPSAALEPAEVPPALAPEDAVTTLPEGAVLRVPLVRGTVLTRTHLDAAGASGALPPGEGLVAVPLDRTWGVEVGTLVDLWDSPGGGRTATPVARGRPVLGLDGDTGRPTALVAVPEGLIADLVALGGDGRLLVTVAPG